MIKVNVTKKVNHYQSLNVTGHAYSDEPGKDLVCAAVSVLAQTLVNALEELGQVPEKQMHLKIDNGLLKFELNDSYQNETIDLLFEHFLIGIKGIESSYSKYVKLRIKEVQGDD